MLSFFTISDKRQSTKKEDCFS